MRESDLATAANITALRDANSRLQLQVSALTSKLASRSLSGTLLLDYTTIKTATGFFALLALVLRSSGMKVVVTGAAGDDKKAANDGVGFNDFKYTFSRIEKFNLAMDLLKEGAVIWVDVDFGTWTKELPRVDNINGLTILNWAAVAHQGVKGKGVTSA